ncbi:hypothetical protein [Mobiluncus mulieris]|uniref:hypothetical protein n=1 Tax=Mobiluncus mulieris TaxID=2052 RepID=UPI002016257C|nr:hypothetical protein [Mobiluncus mulieris]
MDAGLVNGLGAGVAVSRGQVPVMDTVEITGVKPASGSTPMVFDPTAVAGSFEQKHIGGVLATSSAIDGYNGWETMLKHLFGIQNGGDKSDIPVIPSFNWGGHGSYSVEGGYTRPS